MSLSHRGISVSGKQGAGKSTIIRALSVLLGQNGIAAHTISFADPVKSLSKAVLVELGLVKETAAEADWKYQYRTIPQTVGNHLRGYNEHIWVALAATRIQKVPAETVVLNDDCRFPNEAQALRDQGMFLVRIEASRELRAGRVELKNETHTSEISLDDYQNWDLVIHQDHEHPIPLPEVYARKILMAAGFPIRPENAQAALTVPKVPWTEDPTIPDTCDCLGLGCDHAGTKLSWTYSGPRKKVPLGN